MVVIRGKESGKSGSSGRKDEWTWKRKWEWKWKEEEEKKIEEEEEEEKEGEEEEVEEEEEEEEEEERRERRKQLSLFSPRKTAFVSVCFVLFHALLVCLSLCLSLCLFLSVYFLVCLLINLFIIQLPFPVLMYAARLASFLFVQICLQNPLSKQLDNIINNLLVT